jgi:hypothetical protein
MYRCVGGPAIDPDSRAGLDGGACPAIGTRRVCIDGDTAKAEANANDAATAARVAGGYTIATAIGSNGRISSPMGRRHSEIDERN